jgi:uncharacterized protein
MGWDDQDPGLPIKLGPCSNGEYDPVPMSPLVREATRRARIECDELADRLGMSRRRFLLSACGAATTLFVLAACSDEQAKDEGRGKPGGTFDVPSTATTEPESAKETVGGEEVIFDIQTHFLEFTAATTGGTGFAQVFPQSTCGDDDPKSCFSMGHYLEELFLKSDTSMVVLSAVPIAPEGSPLSPEVMAEARRVAEALCEDERVLLHSLALPNVDSIEAALAAMETAVDRYPIAAWKGYTHYTGAGGAPWRLDDERGEAFLRKAVELEVPIVCVHKGLASGDPAASPADIGPAAKAHRDMSFVTYHSGFERDVREGPFDPARPGNGVDRLLASMGDNGIGPNENVYAELGSTWRILMGRPDDAAHVLGKLLKHVGEDNVVWGTDSIWYGSPQDQIQAFRVFQISPELQERHGYPALTKEIKRKILGANALRLHGVDPITTPCEFTRDELERIRQELPGGNATLGPRTAAEVRALVEAHQGWPA